MSVPPPHHGHQTSGKSKKKKSERKGDRGQKEATGQTPECGDGAGGMRGEKKEPGGARVLPRLDGERRGGPAAPRSPALRVALPVCAARRRAAGRVAH